MNSIRAAHRLISLGRWLTLSWLAALCSFVVAGEAAESHGQVVTTDGSVLRCMIAQSAPWTLTTPNGIQTLKMDAIEFIEIGERIDPNVENEANVAVGDLQSDAFETREKAVTKLRSLGRAAAKSLRQAQTSPDAEVAKRARALLVEMGETKDEGQAQDRVHLRDRTILSGELSVPEISVRTHFGRMRFPIEALDSITFFNSSDAQKKDEPFAQPNAKEIAIPIPAANRSEAASARAWTPNSDALTDPTEASWLEEAQRNALTMDKVAEKTTDATSPKAIIATKAGDRLEDAYADRGVRLRATEAASAVEVSGEKMQSFSLGRCLVAKKSDVEIRFTLPGMKSSIPAGVFHVGAIVRTEGPGSIGMAAYDSAGRFLTQVMSGNTPGGAPNGDEFLGIQSKTLISRVRVFRVGAMKDRGADVLLDDIVFDRIVGAGLRENQCRVALIGGDQLVGRAVDAANDSVALKVDFLSEQSDALTIKVAAISSYEPARGSGGQPSKSLHDAKDSQPKQRHFSLHHGVLLQSGESFRAYLFALDDKQAVFGLARGAILKLPREMLRKVELIPEPTPPGEAPPPTALEKDEKPGVDFKKKPRFNDPAAPQPPAEAKKDPAKNPAQGLPRMDDAQILNIDPQTFELTVKDEYGEMTMSLNGVRALVFPANPNAATADKKRAWRLILRGGSRFDADILQIGTADISAEMAGGKVLLPSESVERIERK